MESVKLVNSAEELARVKWKASGLSDEHAARLNLRALTANETAALGPNFERAAALFIPYFTIRGEPTSFYRIRYLEKLPGFAGQAKKPQRYAQAAGTLNEVYLPPIMEFSWWDVACDPNVPIYITEGELKAACGCSLNLPTIGLGGVDVWRSAKRGIDFLPELQLIVWNKRSVIIVYDSDAAINPNVIRAQNQLSEELTARGAVPMIASLPQTEEGQKQGLDDFLVKHGHEALMDILQQATDFPEAKKLWEMNEEVLYVRDPGFVIQRKTGQRISPGAFVQHAYANYHYEETVHTKKGAISQVKRPTAKRWLEWEHRFEAQKCIYAPGDNRLSQDGNWNMWNGWGTEPKPGDVSPWNWLLRYLFYGAPDSALKWFERWCAWPIVHPGDKMFTAVVMWGVAQGTGKTLVAYTLRRIYGDNFGEIKNRDLKSPFNEWAENKQFIYGDEITGGDRRVDSDWLKGVITQEHLNINAKFIPRFSIRDCVNYYFTSNHPDAFFLEDTDRRYFVHEVTVPPAEQKFYKIYDDWLKAGGAEHLFNYFLTLDFEDFSPKATAPTTTSKEQMMYDSKSDVAIWCVHLREDPVDAISYLGHKVADGCDLLTATQLYECYMSGKEHMNVTVNGLSRELKRSGFKQVNGGKVLMTRIGVQRLYAIRNPMKWLSAPVAALRDHYDSFYGGK